MQLIKNFIGWVLGLGRCVECGNTRWKTDIFYAPRATCWRCFLSNPDRDQNVPVYRDDNDDTFRLISWR